MEIKLGSRDTQHGFNLLNKIIKELSPCHKFRFSNPHIFETQCHKPLIVQNHII